MPIVFACPHCGHQLQVADAAAGRTGKCPHCKGSIQVPSRGNAPSTAFSAAPPTAPVSEAPLAGVVA
ncbi:MAG: zinc ribbon-containing protein, partial [Gemmataceae bacterium]|nr:zinc ribbon-containing protein [Gemmataceae bacterium]